LKANKRTRAEIIEKIRRLTEIRTDRGATPSEAAKAIAATQQLLSEYQLTLLDIERATFDERIVEEEVARGRRLETWQQVLAACLCDAYSCTSLGHVRPTAHGRLKILLFIGHDSDVRIARCFFYTLSASLFDEATEHGIDRGLRGRELLQYRSDFIKAASGEIHERLVAERPALEAESNIGSRSTALVQVKKAAVDRWLHDHYPTTRTSYASACSSLAESDGRRAGRQTHLQKGIESKSQKLLEHKTDEET
jgi:hypothetical protein